MLRIQLQNTNRTYLAHLLARSIAEISLHFQCDAALGCQRAGAGRQFIRKLYFRNTLTDRFLHEVKQVLVFDITLFGRLLLFFRFKAQVVPDNVAEALAVLIAKILQHHLVQRVCQVKQLITARFHLFTLR